MTSENIKQATVIIELDNGEFAATATKNRAVIELCTVLLEFKRLPRDLVENLSYAEINWDETLEK